MNPPHVFAARIARMDSGLVAHIVPIPPEIGEEYVAAGTRRVIALLNGSEIRRYLFQTKDGEHAILIGKRSSTREKRALEVARKLRTYTLHDDLREKEEE
ncbi:MAG: hypothetical protein ACI9W4_000296 [Rhodothermales bacterium]|jgi:hypothetical protein